MSAQIIAHPALLAQKRRHKARKQRAERRVLSCSTRYLKYLIEVLCLMMALPKEHPLAPVSHEEKRGMGERLTLYRNELQRRDARDANPLHAKRPTQRVDQLQTKFRKMASA